MQHSHHHLLGTVHQPAISGPGAWIRHDYTTLAIIRHTPFYQCLQLSPYSDYILRKDETTTIVASADNNTALFSLKENLHSSAMSAEASIRLHGRMGIITVVKTNG